MAILILLNVQAFIVEVIIKKLLVSIRTEMAFFVNRNIAAQITLVEQKGTMTKYHTTCR